MPTRETWAARVREWKRSGLTAARFAAREGFNASTLKWWSSTLGTAALASSSPPVVEVLMASRAESPSGLEVLLASGTRVAVPQGFDEATLGRLLKVLEAR